MNMLSIWRKNDPDFIPLDLDPDFEEACARSLQEPIPSSSKRKKGREAVPA